jgi:ABC-type nickel/cobalt efflux system permease component RcnA
MVQEYFIIFFPAFILGILHTLIPCEDKAIFCFWSFGISKNAKRSFFILALYGIGLMSANMIIALVTIGISMVPRFFGFVPDPYGINFFGAFSSTFAAVFLLFFLARRDYMPHSSIKISDELTHLNWEKKRTPYLFGILAGFPPCIFELIVYSQVLTYSLAYGYLEGILTVFYFSIGTFIGLFPLALAKQGTSQILKPKENRRNRIFFIMIILILIFNSIIMLLSFLRIDVFPVQQLTS